SIPARRPRRYHARRRCAWPASCRTHRQNHAVDDAIEAALERGHQVLAGDALGQSGLFESTAELRFQHAVHAPHLLLFAELQTVADDLLCPFLAVLPGDEIALLDGALFAVAALPFEIEFHAL